MTGLEILRNPDTTAEQIVDIIAEHCPPVVPEHCDWLSCRACWEAWLTTKGPPKGEGPSDKQTAPDEEGLHPNLVEMYARAHSKAQLTLHMYAACDSDPSQCPASAQPVQPQQSAP